MVIDIWALVIGAVAYFILGALWYSPLLLGNIWAKAMQFDFDKDEEVNTPIKGLVFSLIGAFLATFALMQMTMLADPTSLGSHLKYAAMAWVGYIASTQMGSVYFNYYDKSPGKIFFINTGYNLVGFMMIVTIIYLFK